MAKPMGLDMLIAAPVEEVEEEMPVEEAPKSDPVALLDELQATLDELRGKLGQLG